jgi:hypothetical protein
MAMSRGSWFWIHWCIVSVAFLSGATATAQSRFHLDYVPKGQTTSIVLVNDSSTTIEAITVTLDCPGSPTIVETDFLDRPEPSGNVRHPAGSPARTVEPRGTWELFSFQNSEKSKYVRECAPRVELVLFCDGSYEGTELQAHILKTWRDGMFASIIEWLEILNRPDADGFDAIGLEKLASKRRDDEQQKALHYCKPGQSDCEESALLSNAFWAGKWTVDAEISGCIDVSELVGRDWCENDRPRGQVFQNTKDFLERWKSKIDEDPAMKRLREAFPPSVLDKAR